MNKSVKVAFGGIITALSVLIMFFSGVIPGMEYALPIVSGVFILPVYFEIGRKWAFPVFVAVSLLSFLIIPNKEPAVNYIMFFGYYPLVKEFLDKVKPKILSMLLKLVFYNVMIILAVIIVSKVFGIPFIDDMSEFGKLTVPIFLVLSNFVFIVYDLCLVRVANIYYNLLHPKVKKYIRK